MFTSSPSLHLEVTYETEDSFSHRVQQQRNHGNFTLAPISSISTVLPFPYDYFIIHHTTHTNTSSEIKIAEGKFKTFCEEHFPYDQEDKIQNRQHATSDVSIAKTKKAATRIIHKKMIKSVYVCFPKENQMNVLQPIGEYLQKTNRCAQGLDRKEFSSFYNHQHNTDYNFSATNRFYHITPQLLVVYADDLNNYSFPDEFQNNLDADKQKRSEKMMRNKNRNENLLAPRPMSVEEYLQDEKKKREGLDQIRTDLKLLSLARPPGGGVGPNRQYENNSSAGLNNTNISLLSLPNISSLNKTVKFDESRNTLHSCDESNDEHDQENRNHQHQDPEWQRMQRRYFYQKDPPCLCPCHEQHKMERRLGWATTTTSTSVHSSSSLSSTSAVLSTRTRCGVKFEISQPVNDDENQPQYF